MTALDR